MGSEGSLVLLGAVGTTVRWAVRLAESILYFPRFFVLAGLLVMVVGRGWRVRHREARCRCACGRCCGLDTPGVERHSSCTQLVTRGEDELWITPFAVIGHVRRQHDDADDRPCRPGPVIRWQADPHRRRASAEERKRRGSTAQAGHRPGVRCSANRRHHDDEAVTARMVPFVERRYVFTGNSVFVCKTNGQHPGSRER